MKQFYFAVLFILAAATDIHAQTQPAPRLVQSFNMYPGTFAGKSGANLNGKFVTDSLGTLLISDGTDTGTHSVYAFYDLLSMLVVSNKLFMIAADSLADGVQLWVSDGTTAGTHLTKSIVNTVGPEGALYFNFSDYSLIAYHNKVFFYGDDSVHGVQLWESDGTDTGTVIVKIINTTPGGNILDLMNYPFGQLKVVNDKLFFAANDGIHGPELWCTDGTAANTYMVSDLWPGPQGANPQYLTAFGDKLCFWAYGPADTGLYITDGTDTGTKLLVAGIMTPNSEQAVMSGKLYFFADSIDAAYSTALWVTDGTAAGTHWVSHAFYSEVQYSYASYLSSFLTAFNNKLYFGAADNLWTSDGTNAGTYLLKTLADEPDLCCTPTQITLFGGKMYMRAADFNGRVEICISDGTDSGTKEVVYPLSDYTTSDNIVTTNYLSLPLTVVGTKLFFWNTYESALGHSIYMIDLLPESVKTIHAGNGISIYPNPATSDIYIETTADNKINKVEVLDMAGQLLLSQSVNLQSKVQVSLGAVNDGMLMVKAYTQNGVFCQKIVTMH